MGGTVFNGLALVRELCEREHEVWIANRGQSEADLPDGVQRLLCDRTDHDALRKTLSGRDFDCIFDVSAYRLEDVEVMSEIFRDRTGHYVFISSTVIYAATNHLPIHESHPVDRSERQNEYGLNKLAAEDFLFRLHHEQGFPATVAALSMVFGPHNILPDREQRMFARLLAGSGIEKVVRDHVSIPEESVFSLANSSFPAVGCTIRWLTSSVAPITPAPCS